MRFMTSILLLAACLSLPAFAAGSAALTMTLSTVAAQLSKAIGRDVIWQAPYGPTVNIESDPQPMTIEEFTKSIEKLNNRMVKEHPEWAPFVVCIFENTVVVRTIAQPACGEPLK